jgi:hypothetical protein
MNDTPDRKHPEKQHEENERLLQLLEAVTAEGAHDAPCNDREGAEQDEYVALRETWLAFGRLLDAAAEAQPIEARSASEEALSIPRLLAEREALSESISAHFTNHYRQVRRLRRIAAVLVAAAAACGILLEVGNLGLNWWLARAGGPLNQGLPVAGQPIEPHVAPQQAMPKAPAPAVAHNEAQAGQHKATAPKQSAAKTSTWDDAIDEEITSVSQQIDSVRQGWRHRVDDVDLVQYRIDDVSAGISNDSL